MAAVPSTPVVALQDDSLNHFIIDSPSLFHGHRADSPYTAGEPESPGKRTRRVGKSPARASLAPRDSNERDGLLVDFGQDEHSRSPAPSTLHPRTPSAFARSLLDKSPSLLKAHLSTPLIPLGTPVTTRKPRSASPTKENTTPSARRTAKHRSPDSPSPAAETPRLASRADVPTPPRTVRFSPSPRRTRSSPRKGAAPAPSSSATAGGPPSLAFHQPSTSSTSSPLARSLHHIGLATPSAASRTHPFASPFPAFSPSTPAIRSHTSYDTDELTDADADGSIWEDEPSMSYPAQPDAQVDEVALAVGGLSLGEQPTAAPAYEAGAVVEQDEGGDLRESSEGELTETETASSEADEDELVGSVEELAPTSIPVEDDAAQTSTPRDEPILDVPGLAEDVVVGPEVVAPVLQGDTAREVAADAVGAPLNDLDAVVPPVDEIEPPRPDERAPADPEPQPSSPPPPAAVQQHLEPQPEPALPILSDQAPVEVETRELIGALVDQAYGDSAVEQPVGTEQVAPVAHEAPASPRDFATAVAPVAEAARRTTPPPSPFLAASAIAQLATPFAPPSLHLRTPSPSRIGDSSSTATTATTPSALQPTQPSLSAAPTARRQLTKLTSVAASRTAPTVATKSSLTTLVPGSTASSSRRLAAPSRLAVPTKRSTAPSLIAETPTVPAATATTSEAPKPAELKRPASALSASSMSTASTGSSAPASSSVRPRAAVRAGLKPPGPSSAASGLARPTLSSSSRSTTTVPAPAPASSARPTAATTSRLSRPLTVPRAAPGASTSTSRLARSETSASAASSRPAAPPRAGPALGATSSAPSLGASRAPARALASSTTGAVARTAPRAALAVRQAAAGAAAPAQPASASPSKARAVRVFDGVVVATKAAPVSAPAPPPRALSPLPRVELVAQADKQDLAPPSLTHATPTSTRSPFLSNPHSPPPSAALRAPASPLRSPRRVPVNSQGAGPALSLGVAPSPLVAPTALVEPADKLTSTAPATLFDPPARSTAPPVVRSAAPRAVRVRRTRATEAELLAAAAPDGLPVPPASEPASAHAAPARTTRRAAAAAVAPPRPAPAPVAPVVRSARRPARREPSAEEVVAALAPAPAPRDEVTVEPTPSATDNAGSSRAPSRSAPQFHPAPAVTQDELNRLTQRNTKRNEQHLNKLKLVTVYMDTDRPPSPTSKLRRSLGSEAPEVVRASTKAGREARAAKRRGALRASVDGTELAQLTAELLAEGDAAAEEVRASAAADEAEAERPRLHFRAAGDDEQYSTPTRAPPIKSKAGTKKRSSAADGEGEGEARRANRAVRWDRALVYEGPKEGEGPVPDASILKVAELDDWGNSTTATTNLGKAVPVTIHMRVFKDEQ
ncbi:hypothetical protein JCM9279_004504 [Rhodotorula babjevae]